MHLSSLFGHGLSEEEEPLLIHLSAPRNEGELASGRATSPLDEGNTVHPLRGTGGNLALVGLFTALFAVVKALKALLRLFLHPEPHKGRLEREAQEQA